MLHDPRIYLVYLQIAFKTRIVGMQELNESRRLKLQIARVYTLFDSVTGAFACIGFWIVSIKKHS